MKIRISYMDADIKTVQDLIEAVRRILPGAKIHWSDARSPSPYMHVYLSDNSTKKGCNQDNDML